MQPSRSRKLVLVGCLAFAAAGVMAVAAVLVVVRPTRVPSIVGQVAPANAERVYSRTCCGYSNAFDIYYGTPDPFDATLAHYRNELEARGFWDSTAHRSNSRRPLGAHWFEIDSQGQGECFALMEFRGTEETIAGHADKIVRLREYPYAYVVRYLGYCGT